MQNALNIFVFCKKLLLILTQLHATCVTADTLNNNLKIIRNKSVATTYL